MIDIHTHILPGVDDGAVDLNMSLDMLKICQNDGITDVVLTPHYYRINEGKLSKFKQAFQALQQEVKSLGMPIHLHLGQEVYFKEPMLEEAKKLTIGRTNYILVEFSTLHEQSIEETIFNLTVLKLKPIVAHIERYPYLNLKDYHSIKLSGGLIQVNASALLGLEGYKMRKKVKYLLKEKLVDFIASDCHNLTSRKPNLKKAYQKVSKKYGKAYADLIFRENALKMINSMT